MNWTTKDILKPIHNTPLPTTPPTNDGRHYHSEAQETFVKGGKHYWKGT